MVRRTLAMNVLVVALWVGASFGAASDGLRWVSIKPTVLFTEEHGTLLQRAEVVIENDAEPVEARLEVKLGEKRWTTTLGLVKKGQMTYTVGVPDIQGPANVEFILRAGGEVKSKMTQRWEPQRHWEIYMVPVTHHDLGYTDTIENILNRYDGYYDDILRFCQETEEWPYESRYRYTVEEAWSIQHYVEHRDEETRAKLRKYIQQDRIDIGALFGNEISALCSHEQLIRLMYPSFRFKRDYGASIKTGSITDVPGLSWGLPTVMAGAGVKYFFAGLPTYFEWGQTGLHTFWDESKILRNGRPDAFYWQGPDGEKVLVYYQGSYGFLEQVGGPHGYEWIERYLPEKLEEFQADGCEFDIMRYIHKGGDNWPPEVEISHAVRQWNDRWAYPKLYVATNTMFFEELEKRSRDLRTFHGELPHTDYVVGAVSTAQQTSINRITHDRLHVAEKAATIAWLTSDGSYPAEDIRQAYDNALLYDEHTWGKDYPAGPIQDQAWNEKSGFAYKAAGLTESILSKSLERIATKVNLEQSGRHVVVFNPLSFERSDVVTVSKFGKPDGLEILDLTTGEKVSHQIVTLDGPQACVPYAAYRYARGQFDSEELYDLMFVAEKVPAMGYKTYRLVEKEITEPFNIGVTVTERSIENRFFKVMLDAQTGAVTSIYDKQLQRELVDPNSPHRVNQYLAKRVQTGQIDSLSDIEIRQGCVGPVCGSLVVEGRGTGCPQVRQEVVLYDKVKRIDFNNRLLKDSTPLLEIYFAFPFAVENPDVRFEGSNSVIEPLRDQFPGSNSNYYAVQHWADVSDGEMGVTLSAIESHLLEFGGLWPCYVSPAHHGVRSPDFGEPFVGADQMRKGHMYAFAMDSNFCTNFQPVQQGDMLFRYRITTHKGRWREGRPRDFGWSAGNPLEAILLEGPQAGPFGHSHSFCHVDKPNVFVLTLKRAEEGDGLIVRLIETEGQAVTTRVTLPYLNIGRVWLTNIVEENQRELIPTPHSLEVSLKAFGITTIRIQRH